MGPGDKLKYKATGAMYTIATLEELDQATDITFQEKWPNDHTVGVFTKVKDKKTMCASLAKCFSPTRRSSDTQPESSPKSDRICGHCIGVDVPKWSKWSLSKHDAFSSVLKPK